MLFRQHRYYYLGLPLGSVVIAASKIVMASASLIADIVCDTARFTQIIWGRIKTIMYGMHGWQKM